MTTNTEKSKEFEPARKNKIGRPSQYDPSLNDSATAYLNTCRDVVKGGRLRVNLPTVEGFALYLGVHRDTLYQWAKEHKEFSDTLGSIKSEQFIRLVNNGLAGNYSSVIAKLMLVTNHAMKEIKEENEHKCESSLSFLLNRALVKGKEQNANIITTPSWSATP